MTGCKPLGKAFKVKIDKIRVLDSPSSFKDALLSILLKANNRICISALYTDDEKEVRCILLNI